MVLILEPLIGQDGTGSRQDGPEQLVLGRGPLPCELASRTAGWNSPGLQLVRRVALGAAGAAGGVGGGCWADTQHGAQRPTRGERLRC